MIALSAVALVLFPAAASVAAPAPAPAASPLAGYEVVDLTKVPPAFRGVCGGAPLLYIKKSDVAAIAKPPAAGDAPAYCLSTDARNAPTFKLTPLPSAADPSKTKLHYMFNNNGLNLSLLGGQGLLLLDAKIHPDWGPREPTAAELAVPAPLPAKPAPALVTAKRKPKPAPSAGSAACAALAKTPDAKTAAACVFPDPKEQAATLAVLTTDQQNQLIAAATAAAKDPAKLAQAAQSWRQTVAAALAPTLRGGALPPAFASANLTRGDALKLYCGDFPPPAAPAPAKTAMAQLQGNAAGQATLDGAAPAADPLAADCAKTAAGPAAPPPPMSVVKPVSDMTAAAPPPPGGAPANAGGLIAGAGAAAGTTAAASSSTTQLHEALGAGVGGLAGLMLGFALLGPVGMALGAVAGVAGGYFVGSKF